MKNQQINFTLVVLIIILLFLLFLLQFVHGFKPVIIIPGSGGSKLEAKLNKTSVNHWYCSMTSDWYTIWVSIPSLLPPAINCWIDNMMLTWNPITKLYSNNLGVQTRVPYADGSTENFEYLDPFIPYGHSDYFHTLVEAMVQAGGIRNVTIRGLPYDFRYAPTSTSGTIWLEKMTNLIEETYECNDYSRVTILSHSLGCLYTLWFLNQKSQEWKDKFILNWIPIAGVFGGAGTGIKQALSGDIKLVSIPGLSPLTVRNKQRSYETIMMLLPTPQVWGNQIIIETPKKNYTSADYEILFEKSNFQYGYERYQLIKNLTEDLIPPGVNTIHMYGTDIDTALHYQYESDVDFDSEPKTINGNGDGTIPLHSLLCAGNKWRNFNYGKSFTEKPYSLRSHAGILKDFQFIQDVIGYLL